MKYLAKTVLIAAVALSGPVAFAQSSGTRAAGDKGTATQAAPATTGNAAVPASPPPNSKAQNKAAGETSTTAGAPAQGGLTQKGK